MSIRKHFLRWFSPTFRRVDDISKVVGQLKKMVYQNKHDIHSFFYEIDGAFSADEVAHMRSIYEYTRRADFSKIYRDFISGLDEDTARYFHCYLNRIIRCVETGNKTIVLTESEKKRIFDICAYMDFYDIDLGDGTFALGRYIFPKKNFISYPTTLESMGLHLLSNYERLTHLDCIDAGACYGDTALVYSHWTTGSIHSFEPIKSSYEALLKTIELNKRTNIIPINKGLSDADGNADFAVFDDCPYSATLLHTSNKSHTETAQLTTIDRYVKANNLKIGLIKADVEGAERMLLEGAKETIKEQNPALLISIYHSAEDLFLIKPLIESWNLGYQFQLFKPTAFSLVTEMLLIAEVKSPPQ
ncbi:hypothetical protein RsTz2092_11190 [Deferribacterales bacterium RsTz2092]|nr:hypothetical protein AGMMS49941_11560 [Deferribacterales bacterium]